MARYQHIAFVCTNTRDASDPRGSCAARGGEELLASMKKAVVDRGLKGKVRVTKSGCLDFCARGCAVAVFSGTEPRETWYTRVQPTDAEEIVDSHLQNATVVARLLDKK